MNNPILVFANQKGGTGKTTLCMALANWLANAGYYVQVYDCDPQESILKQREADEEKYGKDSVRYAVHKLDLSKEGIGQRTVADIRKSKERVITLFDTPGYLETNGLCELLIFADYILCPFKWNYMNIAATSEFLQHLERIKYSVRKVIDSNSKLVFVPNQHEKSIGTKAEKEFWEETRNLFSDLGAFSPEVKRRTDMEQRINTVALMGSQPATVEDTFNYILELLGESNDMESES